MPAERSVDVDLMWIPQRGEMVESELDSLIRRRDTHRRQAHQTPMYAFSSIVPQKWGGGFEPAAKPTSVERALVIGRASTPYKQKYQLILGGLRVGTRVRPDAERASSRDA